MSSSAVLKEIGDALENLIRGEWKFSVPPVPVISSEPPCTIPRDEKTPDTLSMYLYRITVNNTLRNVEGRVGPDGIRFRPSLPLDLRYLVTPVGRTSKNELLILGRAMQIFHNNPIIPPGYFPERGSLEAGQTPGIMFDQLSLDDCAEIWQGLFQAPARLCVGYVVRPVLIDPADAGETAQRIIRR